jgi:hypothetical protein
MNLKEEAMARRGCRASEKKNNLQSRPRSSQYCLSFRISYQSCHSLFSLLCYVLFPYHPPWFDHSEINCDEYKLWSRRFEGTYRLHLQGLLGVFLDPEDGGDIPLRNVGWHSTDCTALYPRVPCINEVYCRLSYWCRPAVTLLLLVQAKMATQTYVGRTSVEEYNATSDLSQRRTVELVRVRVYRVYVSMVRHLCNVSLADFISESSPTVFIL